MFESFVALALSVMGYEVPVNHYTIYHSIPGLEETKPVDWKCSDLQWTTFQYNGGILEASIATECSFNGVKGGGFPQLENYLHEKVTKGPEVVKLHDGPVAETYAELPSNFYDVTMNLMQADDKVVIRQDIHVATNKDTKLVFDSFSTQVSGTGNAKYLRTVNTSSNIQTTEKEGRYKNAFTSYFRIQKPWYAPGGMFQSEVKKAIERSFPKVAEQTLTELGNNM